MKKKIEHLLVLYTSYNIYLVLYTRAPCLVIPTQLNIEAKKEEEIVESSMIRLENNEKDFCCVSGPGYLTHDNY